MSKYTKKIPDPKIRDQIQLHSFQNQIVLHLAQVDDLGGLCLNKVVVPLLSVFLAHIVLDHNITIGRNASGNKGLRIFI